MTVTVHEAKTTLSQLLNRAAEGEEVIIARGKTPVARLVPMSEAPSERELGFLKGKLAVGPEFFEPLPDEELQAWGQ